MKRHAVFTITVEFDESTFGIDDPESEVRDFDEIVLPDVAHELGRAAVRLLDFHADGVVAADTRAEMSRPFDEITEPF